MKEKRIPFEAFPLSVLPPLPPLSINPYAFTCKIHTKKTGPRSEVKSIARVCACTGKPLTPSSLRRGASR